MYILFTKAKEISMQNNDEKFVYNYSAPTHDERREIQSIINQYTLINEKTSEFDELKRLNKKVKGRATTISLIVGVFGLLVFGLGLSLVLEWQKYVLGVVVGIVGFVPMSLAYAVFKVVFERNKAKYGKRIVDLGHRLLNSDDDA